MVRALQSIVQLLTAPFRTITNQPTQGLISPNELQSSLCKIYKCTLLIVLFGTPNGTRTRILALKGLCPNSLRRWEHIFHLQIHYIIHLQICQQLFSIILNFFVKDIFVNNKIYLLKINLVAGVGLEPTYTRI